MSEAKFPCPECEAELGYSGAKKCKACGWEARKPGKTDDRHIPDSCEYQTAMGERCQYPATMSSSTLGGGPWFCRFHFWDRASSIADQMVEASRDFVKRSEEPTPEALEAGAREVAARFGVDPTLPPKDRAMAVLAAWKAIRKKAA